MGFRTQLEQIQIALNRHAIVSVADAEGIIIEVNDKFCQISGYSETELLGQNHRLLKSGRHDAHFYDDLWRTISSGEIWQGVVCNRAKDGSFYWVDSTILPVLDEQGQPERYVSIRTDITQLWQQKEQVVRKKDLFELAANATGLGLVIGYPREGQVVLDARAAQVFGLPSTQVEQRLPESVIFDRILEADRQTILDKLRAAYRERDVESHQHRIVDDEGQVKHLKVTFQTDAREGVPRVLTTILDVTDEVLQSERLAEANESKDKFLANLKVASAAVNLVIFEENLDKGTGEFIIQPDSEHDAPVLLGDARRKAVPAEFHHLIDYAYAHPGEWVEYPIQIPGMDHAKWIACSVIQEFVREGERCCTVISWDITDRINRENELRETLRENQELVLHAEQLSGSLQAAVNKADIFIYEENLDEEWGYCIFRAGDPYGEALVGQELYDAVPPAYRHLITESHAKIGRAVEFPIKFPNSDQLKWVRHSVIRRYEKDGHPYQLAMSMNISDLVAQREQLKEALESQQKALDENQSLLGSLEESNRKKNQVYGMIAHELRTPVSAIQMMADDDTPSEWGSHQGEVRKAAQQLLHTIDDMRMIVNPDLKRPYRVEHFTLADLASSISTNVSSAVASTGVRFKLMMLVDPALQSVNFKADIYRIKVAVTNLVRNACLHSEGTDVWLAIEAEQVDENDWRFYWIVSDNGKGIEKDRVEQLFDPYVRGETRSEGTGLGLHIARSWVREIGGDLTYRQRSPGAEFTAVFPVIRCESEAAGAQTGDQSEGSGKVLSAMKVLMVDDDPMLRLVGQQLLSKLVREVEVAENGADAMKKLDDSFDLVLTDYFMPELNGVELIKRIRASGFDLPIIGLTAATLGNQVDDMRIAGADLVLPKPLTKLSLIDAVGQLNQRDR